jgi:hypothetical protein
VLNDAQWHRDYLLLSINKPHKISGNSHLGPHQLQADPDDVSFWLFSFFDLGPPLFPETSAGRDCEFLNVKVKIISK